VVVIIAQKQNTICSS